MGTELRIVESAKFGGTVADFYEKDSTIYMTTDQLAECLGYANGKKGIGNIIARYPYLKEDEFSSVLNLRTEAGMRETRVFTEDGIYEVTFLAKTDRARSFRAWVRRVLKELRKGNARLVPMTGYQQMIAETRKRNASIRAAQILERLARQYEGTYRQVLQAYATKELTGGFLLPLPQLHEKTYSASEIGAMLGISAQKVGILANANGLKTEAHGAYFNDKAKNSNKEVQSFRYYESCIDVFRSLLAQA